MAKIGRNQPCPCGSGKKYKRCCWDRDRAAHVQPAQPQANPETFVEQLVKIGIFVRPE